ncbi:MAG: dicarboxylate/amino acid:cation symporter [Deltaproteobacteria bacterium]|nr:dicarboxylate/amino acid:cation symporter [Deltaproteobacteria bacterium]
MNPKKMLLGIAAGVGLGLLLRAIAPTAPWAIWCNENLAYALGQLFLRLLFLLVVPMILSALVVGIAGMDLSRLGRLGVRTLIYTVVVSGIAVVIGIALVNIVQPGVGHSDVLRALAERGATLAVTPSPPSARTIDLVVAMIPNNFIAVAAAGDMIGVIVFSVIFAIAASVTPTEPARRLVEWMQGLYDIMMTCIAGVMRLAPVGVGALMFSMTFRMGADLLRPLAAYVAVVIGGILIHMFGTYSILLKVVCKRSPVAFFRSCRLAMTTAFSTASSSASLPAALKVADEELKLPKGPSHFVLTVGASMNQNGTALFEGITVLFLAQLYGVPLSIGQQVLVMGISILGGVGTAGVPAGSLPVIAMILAMLKIPPEGLGLILGVDRFLDMCRTTLNVMGDLVAAAVLSTTEADGSPIEE